MLIRGIIHPLVPLDYGAGKFVAVQTGGLDGIAWSGITEDYTAGWADVTNYFLTNTQFSTF